MNIKTISVSGWEGAIKGMREPFQSFAKNDTTYDPLVIGHNDLDLCHRLLMAGSDSDSKFLRYIHVQAEITAPLYWWSEAETYKIGTTGNSSSVQHIGAKRDYTIDDFTIDNVVEGEDIFNSRRLMQKAIDGVNEARRLYKDTNDYEFFRVMRQLLPAGFNYTKMWDANYQTLRTIYKQRIDRPHRLKEWTENFANWINSLPYAKELIECQQPHS